MNTFEKLNQINVNDHTEQKNGLTYLSWAWAWAGVKSHYPDANYEIWHDADGRPYLADEDLGYMVFTKVTIDGQTHEMWLPVMDGANNAMKSEPYSYKTKWGKEITVNAATMFDVNKAIMRCLVKNLAMFGLGLYIYAGEDLPEDTSTAKETKTEPSVREQIIMFCDEHGLNLKQISEQYSITKGMTESVLKAKLDMLMKDYA